MLEVYRFLIVFRFLIVLKSHVLHSCSILRCVRAAVSRFDSIASVSRFDSIETVPRFDKLKSHVLRNCSIRMRILWFHI